MTSDPFAAGISVCAVIAPLVRLNCRDVSPSPCSMPSTYGASGVEGGPDHPAGLAVGVDALPEKLDAGLQDEVSRHALPDEMELVSLGPHVHAAGREAVHSCDTPLYSAAPAIFGLPTSS